MKNVLYSNRAIIDILARADDFETMEDLTAAARRHIEPTIPANAPLLDINILEPYYPLPLSAISFHLLNAFLNIEPQLILQFLNYIVCVCNVEHNVYPLLYGCRIKDKKILYLPIIKRS